MAAKDNDHDLLPLLKKIAAENNFKKPDIKVKPISTGGANYSSLLYLADISGDGHDVLRLFVKVAIMGEQMRNMTSLSPYDNEIFIYTDLMPAFKQIEDRHGVSEAHRLRYPKYYGSDPTYLREVLVLENLACQGFVLQDRFKSVDWEYAAAAISQLARFHALCFAYEHEEPKQFEKVVPRFNHNMFNDDEGTQHLFNTSVKTTLAAVREGNRGLLKSFLDRYNIIEFVNFFEALRRPVLVHGDFRPSNMLHKTKKDGQWRRDGVQWKTGVTVELIPVDYQTIQYGSPVIDLLYFIFTATDGSARAQFYHKLVEHYHSELGAALERLGLKVQNIYSKEDFLHELELKLPYGLLLSCLMLPILLVSEEDAPKLDAELDFKSMAVVATGDLYKKRLNEVVDDYIAWGVLKG